MKTLLLDTAAWDLVLDAAGNIAVAEAPYQLSQDVASAIKTFAGEVWFDTTLGVPYFSTILGKTPPIEYFKDQMVRAAKTVPGVVTATCVVVGFENRTVTGYVKFTDTSGNTGSVSL